MRRLAGPPDTLLGTRASRLMLLLIVLAAWGGFLALLGYDLVQSRQREYELAWRDADNLTLMLERHLGSTVQKIDIVLREAARDASPARTEVMVADLDRELRRHMEALPAAQLESLRVIDTAGRVAHDAAEADAHPEVSVEDRAYFRRHRKDPQAGLVVSEPILSRFTNRWVVTLSRRIDDAGGVFAGVVRAAMPADYLQQLFDTLNLGENGTIGLYDTEMRLIARHPVRPDQIGKAYTLTEIIEGLKAGRATGTYAVASRVDGVQRDYVYRKLDGLPFVALVGQSTEDILAGWRRKAALYGISALAMALELAALMWLLGKLARDRISYVATHDRLTDLPNQVSLDGDRRNTTAEGESMALLALDLDNFKNINDSLGHQVGDRVLVETAERLRRALRDSDTVTRQGGDEFIVVLKGFAGSETAAQLAQRLLDEVARPFQVGSHELVLTASIGIAVHPDHGEDAGTLLKHADAAMYQAKEAGRNTFRFFTEELNTRLAERLLIENGLRKAVANRELHLHYQPQFETQSGRLIGFEALLRWEHPELGPIPPDRFIPIAEESGLIVPIGEWVLDEACRQNKAWRESGLPPVAVAVNLSAVQFRHMDVVGMVRAALDKWGIEPDWLELEVTESALMHDVEQVAATLHELEGLGIKLSIDDFGTGYSSLSYLRRFPIHKIKIDQSFVRDVDVSGDGAAIIQSIIAIAGKMGMRAIAEGVETRAHLDAMHEFGCDEVQGFLFGKAVPPAEAERFFDDCCGPDKHRD